MGLRRIVRLAGLTVIAGAVSAIPVATASASAQLKGEGSTLVAPMVALWGPAWANDTGNTAPSYTADGSGAGHTGIANGLDDFGASDAPLSGYSTPCASCHQIPWALTATGVSWHVPGIKHLRLTGKVLAEIYLGQITNWDSSQIKKLNKREHFPNLKITPIHRLDASGDSYAFTDYLSRVSSNFKHRVGRGTQPSFPTGVAGKGNSGMVQVLGSTNGGIAYIAVTYLITHHLGAVSIKNAAGRFETPNYKNIANAAKGVHPPSSMEMHIVDPNKRHKIAYPISTFSYVFFKSTDPLGHGAELKNFVGWAVTKGQSIGPSIDFVELPVNIVNADKNALSLIH